MRTSLGFWLLALLFSFGLVAPPASAADDGRRVYKEKEAGEQELTEEQKQAAEEAAQKRRDRAARVVVLKWNDTDVGYEDELIRRIVRNRIDRPDALFFPSTDLYQNGRKAPDRTLTPAMQPARVADADLSGLVAEAERVSQIPWNGLGPDEWRNEAAKLRNLLDTVWFVSELEHREPLFVAYANIGRAAENSGSQAPPFFEAIAGKSVNYYYYLAASLAFQDPSLMSKLLDQEVNGAVNYYLSEMQKGAYPTFPLDFELDGEFDIEDFEKEYQVFLNGVEAEIDAEARVQVLLGRSDIYLKRKDTGHGLSERLEVDKFEDKAYFVRDVARKRMGLEFIEQLMLHPNECSPELEGDILNFLSIYAKLHGSTEVYIAVPKEGNANKTYIWRWDRSTATLQLVGGGADGFPVHFAFTASGGVLYNQAAANVDTSFTSENAQSFANSGVDFTSELSGRVSESLTEARIPFSLELRAHWNRLMVSHGYEFGYGAEGYVENYYTKGVEPGKALLESSGTDANGTDTFTPVFNEQQWNRYTFFGLGVVLGPNANLGIGPRFAAKVGWTNLPHALQTTGHFGWTFQMPYLPSGERVKPILDLDARGGIVLPAPNSLYTKEITPLFGLTGGVGLTF